uniref:Uncharacterized protein n=1 Tax=Anguilla anguilla TaxID=7936 RepID=A0A0E9Q8L4_ANGAN
MVWSDYSRLIKFVLENGIYSTMLFSLS